MRLSSLGMGLLALTFLFPSTVRAQRVTPTAEGPTVPTNQLPTDDSTTVKDPDEYTVWSTVLAKKYADRNYLKLVIRNRTAIDLWHHSEHDGEAFSDLKAKNKAQSLLENNFSVKLPCILMTPEAESKLFYSTPSERKDKGFIEKVHSSWNQFYEEYPGAQGILTISRVGFNSDKSEAVVYIQNVANVMVASGKLFFLTKKNGTWEVQTEEMIWFS
jgi:hypothetical protein